MPVVFVLVGVPGSGKSTWLKTQHGIKDFVYVSSDQYIDDKAAAEGKTYSEVFDKYIGAATQHVRQTVQAAREAQKDIIWDQTNVSTKSRRKVTRALPEYHKVAVVFATPDPAELKKRLANRPGKEIPDKVVQSMIANFQEPTEAEGFDDIWHIN